MSALYDKGRNAFLTGSIAWLADTIEIVLTSQSYGVAVTAATNATPVQITTAIPHGLVTGDVVTIYGSTGNTTPNNLWPTVTVIDASNFTLDNSTGNGAWVSGGRVVKLSEDAFLSDIVAGVRVATSGALAGKTAMNGIADANDVTFVALAGATVQAVVIFKSTGVEGTSNLIAYIDDNVTVTNIVTVAGGATTLNVCPISSALPSGATLVFSGGTTATLSAPAVAGALSLSVNALGAGIVAGEFALGNTGTGLPVVPNGGNLSLIFDDGPNKIFKL